MSGLRLTDDRAERPEADIMQSMDVYASNLGATPVSMMGRGDIDERAGLCKMLADARDFLRSRHWCDQIKSEHFGLGVSDVVAVFLFNIENKAAPGDGWLWVIVGDLPPAYLVIDDNRSPSAALATYVRLMREWVEAASKGRPVGRLIPVNVPATPKNAKQLATRLDFLEHEFLGG
jgi:hypothetical protein